MASVPLRLAATAQIDVGMASGRTLSAPVAAAEDVPPFARSRVDGYAVVGADVLDASPEHPVRVRVVGEIAMGAPPPGSIARGEAMRISTGGALPAGADAAVMVEDTVESGGIVTIHGESHAADNVTLAGADVRAGTRLFDVGTLITPARAGLLSGAGIARVEAFVPPRVALLLTGDELIAPDQPMHAGQIRDINRYSLSAALVAMGFAPVQYDRVPDERTPFADAFSRALAQCDAVVVSGGSSAGERDYTPDIVSRAGPPGVVVHHVRAKPGRPTLLGAVGDKPVIGLPGNPVSALVMLETLGKPILLRMLARAPAGVPVRAVLTETIDAGKHLEHRIPVQLRREGDRVYADPLFGTSAMMRILAFADALVAVPLGVGRIEKGVTVDALPLSGANDLAEHRSP